MRNCALFILLLLEVTTVSVNGWSAPLSQTKLTALRASTAATKAPSGFPVAFRPSTRSISLAAAAATALQDEDEENRPGGLFAFKTRFGSLNPYGILYGSVAIFYGLIWYFALTCCQLFYFITRGRVDKQRILANFVNQVWGTLTMRTTFAYPKIENIDILKKFYKENRPAMFVANHASFQDIPFLGLTIGWRNYKMVAKKELLKVPILGKAIAVGGNITLDRKNRRDQLLALKKGIDYLKNNVHLCTFPEGTRSRSGRLMQFKSGAFKMASKAGAPIVPIVLVGSAVVQPPTFMFPCRSGRKIAKVVVCEPIETQGKDEADVEKEVRAAMIAALPENQRPKN